MLNVEMTPNLAGFKVAGTYHDLDELYDAVWALSIADDDYSKGSRPRGTQDEQIMSTRLLALNYDLRHAYQGDRNIELVESGMDEWDAEYHGIALTENNVVFSVEILYPEAMYETLVLNYLIDKRKASLYGNAKRNYGARDTDMSMLDKTICIARMYISKLLEAVQAQATPGRFLRICNEVARGYYAVPLMYQQWVDVLNGDYMSSTRKQREESLSTIVRDLANYIDCDQYLDLHADIDAFCRKNNTHRDSVSITGIYDDDSELEW